MSSIKFAGKEQETYPSTIDYLSSIIAPKSSKPEIPVKEPTPKPETTPKVRKLEPYELFKGHSDLVNLKSLASLKVLMVGAGSIGSFACVSMMKMGVSDITVFDNDQIEPHNFANQIYSHRSMGRKKITELQALMEHYGANLPETGVGFFGKEERFGNEHQDLVKTSDILISAVDNMATRLTLWELAKRSIRTTIFIDCRIGGTVLDCFAIRPMDPNDIDFFEQKSSDGKSEYLYSSEETVRIKCTEKSIIFPVLGSAAWISNCLFHVANKTLNRLPIYMSMNYANLNLPTMVVSRSV